MFIGKALVIAAAASGAAIPASWQPVALDDWHVRAGDGSCSMILPLGQEGSETVTGALTIGARRDGLVIVNIGRQGWALPRERGSIKIWFDDAYPKLRPLYDQAAELSAINENGSVYTVVDGNFAFLAGEKTSMDVVIEGEGLREPQRLTLPLGDMKSVFDEMNACLAAN
ncbi:hypothetical protein I5L01_14980 [Erythrobacter sp. YJ-T3-07]|uniref:hypothetical protein n=1 Tax=Erythrobacter sp. YJ-T3-07 TaxID=2793063 RepID=UPI0018D2A4C9|nr:hypothetical protein [Erythrobacter sp. YJ-T3-07]MBH1945528.1 hypothetical protein [Erythrobacter sp. YJ-T3-07]